MKYSMLFVIIVAISSVSIEKLTLSIDPAFLLFNMTIVAMIYFHLLNFNNILGIYKKAYEKAFLNIVIMSAREKDFEWANYQRGT